MSKLTEIAEKIDYFISVNSWLKVRELEEEFKKEIDKKRFGEDATSDDRFS